MITAMFLRELSPPLAFVTNPLLLVALSFSVDAADCVIGKAKGPACLFGDIGPRCGGTQILSGSHRLIHDWFRDHPPPPGARSADMRRLLQSHPYIRDLHTPGDP